MTRPDKDGFPRCIGCHKPEPHYYCWESRWDCPCEKSPRYGSEDTRVIRTLVWLLAELTWKVESREPRRWRCRD